MKTGNIILIAIAVYLLTRKKKPVQLPAIEQAKADARQIANRVISETNFVADTTTDADLYRADQKNCR